VTELNFDVPEFTELPAYKRLRGRQAEWVDATDTDLETYSRVLVVAPGGLGKTQLMGALAERWHYLDRRTLVLENRDRLVDQTAARIRNETGLEVDVERADDHASPFASIVVASVQTLCRQNRLTGFSPNHFQGVIVDECHFSLSPGYQRILRYFHYSAESLAEDWQQPEDGTYAPLCKIVGFTATPDIGERRSLMDFYQHRSVNYSYLEAVEDGWLVRAVQKCIPIKIDTRKLKVSSGPTGVDFNATQLSEMMIPIIEKLADQIAEHARDRKTMAFLPSVDCARLMADAVARRGMNSIFVSGECFDADEKADAFAAAGPGTVLSNAVIYAFGVDFPDVDCIAWFRATLSKAFYVQGLYRASRVLPGVIDGLKTAEERLAAIAASRKTHFLVLDPLFVSDRIDLIDTYDIYSDDQRTKDEMKKLGPPSPENAERAVRDTIKALEKAAKKEAWKKARTIDPIKFALNIGSDALANYVPQSPKDGGPITVGQLGFFKRCRIDHTKITCFGQAQLIIRRFLARHQLKLATPEQLDFMHKLGITTSETMTAAEARTAIDLKLRR
jgi:superfamily II DNA or RNA helicase